MDSYENYCCKQFMLPIIQIHSGFHPVDENECILNSPTVNAGGFHRSDENRWKVKNWWKHSQNLTRKFDIEQIT